MDDALPIGLAPTALRLDGIQPDEFWSACPAALGAAIIVRDHRYPMFAKRWLAVAGGRADEIWSIPCDNNFDVVRVLYAGADPDYARALATVVSELQQAGAASIETAIMALRLDGLLRAGAALPDMHCLEVVSSAQVGAPADYSEAELFAHSLRLRAAEDRPPRFERHAAGTIIRYYPSAGQPQEYIELREVGVDDPRLAPCEKPDNQGTVDKYAGWMTAGCLPPPIRAYELVDGRLSIGDGHHRLAAARQAGVRALLARVHPTRVAQLEGGEWFPYDVNADTVAAWAESIRPWPDVLAMQERPEAIYASCSVA